MGPSPTNGLARHPGDEHYQQNLHSDLATSHNPPLPQSEERGGPQRHFPPNLRREQFLLTHLLLSGHPLRAHPGHYRSGHAGGNFASPNSSTFRRTRERPSSGNEDPSPPLNGTGLLIKIRSGQDTGPEVPRPRVHTRSVTFDTKLREASGGLPGRGDPDLFVDGDVAASH